MLAVGYGTTRDGDDYYLLKNSWGKEWGEEGYFKLRRNANNTCGIGVMSIAPLAFLSQASLINIMDTTKPELSSIP